MNSCALELGIFVSHLIWLLRTRQVRREAKARGKTFDELAAEYETSGEPFKFAERKTKKSSRSRELSVLEAGSDSSHEAPSREQSDVEKQQARGAGHVLS